LQGGGHGWHVGFLCLFFFFAEPLGFTLGLGLVIAATATPERRAWVTFLLGCWGFLGFFFFFFELLVHAGFFLGFFFLVVVVGFFALDAEDEAAGPEKRAAGIAAR